VAARRPSGWAWLLVAVVGLMVAALGVLGVVVSFESVEAALEPSFGDSAWKVPVGVDLGIGVVTVLDLLMTWLDVRARPRWLRVVPWILTGITIYLNVAVETDLLGRVAHGVLPCLWVVAVEAGLRPVLAEWAGITHGRSLPGAPVQLGLSRWVLAPWPTLRLWRRLRMLEGITPEALRLDRDQDLAKAALADRYGPIVWRVRAPRRLRVMYRHGTLTPAMVAAAPDGRDHDSHTVPSEPGVETAAARSGTGELAVRGNGHPPSGSAKRQSRGAKRGNGSAARRQVTDAELEAAGHRIAASRAAEGLPLTTRILRDRLNAEGIGVGNDRLTKLHARLQAQGDHL
jgi:hypothetical protein